MLKRTLFCLSLFCSTLSYGQDGSSVAATAELKPAQSIDQQSIVMAGPAVEFRLKSVYDQPQQLAHTQMYFQSAQYLIDANCSARTMTIRQGRYFSTYGAEVYSFSKMPAPSNVDPKTMGNIGRSAIDSVCRQPDAKKSI